jgi:hypothetical protein
MNLVLLGEFGAKWGQIEGEHSRTENIYGKGTMKSYDGRAPIYE